MRLKKVLASALTAAMMVSMIPFVASADSGITLSTIQNPKLKAELEKRDCAPKDGKLTGTELAIGVTLDISNMDITDDDFSVLSSFEYINGLNCSNNKITKLDAISGLTTMEKLDCSNNSISSLYPILGFSKLTDLDCSNTRVVLFSNKYDNTKQMSSLTNFKCTGSWLTTVYIYSDVIETIDVSDNQITELKLFSGMSTLKELYVQNNQLEEIAVSDFTSLKKLDCSNNFLQELAVPKSTTLYNLKCYGNEITALDVKGTDLTPAIVSGYVNDKENARGTYIEFSRMGTVLSVDKFTTITHDAGVRAGVSDAVAPVGISVTNFPDPNFRNYIRHFDTDKNGVLTPDEIENAKVIKVPNLGITDMTGLDNFTNLVELDCSGNKISDLDLSNNENLEILDCSNNNLTSLDLSKQPKLKKLFTQGNKLSSLDVSNSPKIVDAINSGNDVLADSKYAKDVLKVPESELANWKDYDIIDEVFKVDSAVSLTPAVPTPTPTVTPTPTTAPTGTPTTGTPTVAPSTTGTPTTTPSDSGKPTGNPTTTPGSTDKPSTDDPSKDPSKDPTTDPTKETGVGGFVERLYTVAMERESDPKGKEYWVQAIKMDGMSGADVALRFLLSEEFLGKDKSTDEFLQTLYRTFFDRVGEEGGMKYWAGEMTSGRKTKTDVIYGFINSEEWANICLSYGIKSGTSVKPTITITPNQNIKDFAERLYTTCLNRDSDKEGLNYWANELANLRKSGSAVAKDFFFSDEFKGFKLSDEEYVSRLYKTIMGREPEADGFNYWIAEMKSGKKNREDVFEGFACSAEWIGICADYGILR